MSSLSAAGADGYYHPPNWDPQKHGSRNKFQKSKGASQYERFGVVRFELPYNCWCLGCNRAIGLGTRYNAKKKSIGKYFSTTIYEFRMKCATCPQDFVIQTDPKNRDYAFVSGIRRINSTPTAESAETIKLLSDKEKEERDADPLKKLEHLEHDKSVAKKEQHRLIGLMEISERNSANAFATNQLLRSKARKERKKDLDSKMQGKRLGLPYPLLDASKHDTNEAKAVFQQSSEVQVIMSGENREKRRRMEIQNEPIFQHHSIQHKQYNHLSHIKKKVLVNKGTIPKLTIKEPSNDDQLVLQVVRRRKKKKRKAQE